MRIATIRRKLALLLAAVISVSGLVMVTAQPAAAACGFSQMPGPHVWRDTHSQTVFATVSLYYNSCPDQRTVWAEIDTDTYMLHCYVPSEYWSMSLDIVDENMRQVQHVTSPWTNYYSGISTIPIKIDNYAAPKNFQARGWFGISTSPSGPAYTGGYADSSWHSFSYGGDGGGGFGAGVSTGTIMSC
ncbi:hypothetical protein [Streptomyces sp. NRRL B-24484]|uniref:hypothetical protein n=1 Tax=Streptomyces sp. NRRL B-24484 TaxID=1463833 RepID=UPI0004C1E34A|nr:hypothetical protein [Streptomyces sp. NRRL B-24484]